MLTRSLISLTDGLGGKYVIYFIRKYFTYIFHINKVINMNYYILKMILNNVNHLK
jgi:hypothetical protein